MPLPLDWLGEALREPLLSRLLAAGWVPPLERTRLEPLVRRQPAAIRSLGDKVSARHIAQRAGAPQVPGTADPVAEIGRAHV